jgi:hypothetical protein
MTKLIRFAERDPEKVTALEGRIRVPTIFSRLERYSFYVDQSIPG